MARYFYLVKTAFITALFLSSEVSFAQTFNQAANNAFIVSRMVDKLHVQPRDLNDSLSGDFFSQLLKQLDEEHVYFNKEDIQQLAVYRLQLDDEVKQKQSVFLTLVKNLYSKRLQQADTIIDAVSRQPFDFSKPEKFTLAEDTSYPASVAAMHSKLYKKIKLETLYHLLDINDELNENDKKKYRYEFDSAAIDLQKKTISAYKRNIQRIMQSPGGLDQFIANNYCSALACCYDPHTEFFPLTEAENFAGELGSQSFRFGFAIKDDAGGGVTINELEPGSSAFKSGMLNKGDKFQILQWEKQSAIDVSDASAVEISRILSQSNHDRLTITVKKADGSLRTLTLVKTPVDPDDDAKVKSFILKGNKTFGYISLPAFYNDGDETMTGSGCANDVAKEIIKLKKENINGLILDLRYNGGGSVHEAAELAGIFIDAGPVAQIKSSYEEKIFTLKDVNRGTIYDGPLIVLVNGYSASASEMLAAALQDYNRALIVGSPTFGKATGQLVLPLDTSINIREYAGDKKTDYYLKLTTIKLYRVNGTTAQFNGVKPDIILPDFLQARAEREASEPFALPPTIIDANKYYRPYAALQVDALKTVAAQDMDTMSYFKRLAAYIQKYREEIKPADVSLNWADAIALNKKDPAAQPAVGNDYSNNYTISNNAYDMEKLKVDASSGDLNESFKKFLLHDPYIKITFDVLEVMNK